MKLPSVWSAGRMRPRRMIMYAGLTVAALVMLYPLLWIVLNSFDTSVDTSGALLSWPTHPTLQNYLDGWAGFYGDSFGRYFLNSTIVCMAAVIGNVFSCSFAAYALARINFRLRGLWFALMLGSIMLPYHAVVIPQYIAFNFLGWVNSFLPLVVPKFLACDAFFVYLMVQFMRSLPRELSDAARVDGCGHLGIFFRIIMPLSLPAVAVTAVFTFIWTWNDFFSALIYLTDQKLLTVPVALNLFLDSQGMSDFGGLFAMSVLSLVPLLIVFALAQRYLVEGIATTGLKG
jgi:multiple sugar transport system permease protein